MSSQANPARDFISTINRFALFAVWGGFCLFSLVVGIAQAAHGELWFAALCVYGSAISAAGALRDWGWVAPFTFFAAAGFVFAPAVSPPGPHHEDDIGRFLIGATVGFALGIALDCILAKRKTDPVDTVRLSAADDTTPLDEE
jgi:hypothetical protein